MAQTKTNLNKNTDSDNVLSLNFGKVNLPVPYQNITGNSEKRVDYGLTNLYPYFLLNLYNSSPTHSSIVNSKVSYIFGDGLKYSDGKEIDYKINLIDTFDEFVTKILFNYLIFNYFAIEIIYNSLGQPLHYNVINSEQIRTNKSKTKFWFRENWELLTQEIIFDSFDLNNTKNTTSTIFYFDGFSGGGLVYPYPDYSSGLVSIDTERQINLFNQNQLANNFSPTTVIDWFVGENLSLEQKQNTLKAVEQAYSGSEGKKFICSFNAKDAKETKITQLSPNSWGDVYLNLINTVQSNIMICHSVTSPSLFGIKTEGQLGGATELETAYQIFSNTYVRSKRRQIESALNLLFSNNSNFVNSVAFQNKALFNSEIADATKEKIYTINELRAEAGLQSLGSKYDVLIAELEGSKNITLPNEIDSKQSDKSIDEIVKKNDKKNWVKKSLTVDDFEKVKHLGSLKEDFEIVKNHKFKFNKQFKFDLSADIANFIISNDISNLTYQQIVELLAQNNIQTSVNELQNVLNELKNANMITINENIDGSKIDILPSQIANIPDSDSDVVLMYDYQKRSGVSGTTIISTTRDFCRMVIESNKYFSREDISNMSDVFGFDIFKFCGGFFFDPTTGETTPFCRHIWNPIAVKKKVKEDE